MQNFEQLLSATAHVADRLIPYYVRWVPSGDPTIISLLRRLTCRSASTGKPRTYLVNCASIKPAASSHVGEQGG